ncbi:hypothetical protein [Rufibacter quisquiliarum]|uniref:Uncharacterized protein n=1 Tax=Rufibacter quisquiliarum TaxID=1549639 RepID=A0A839GNE7_9BACT|nr:hypothetical protein [Rufibacter quisquiliarum]MBA9078339.1 hypothetical protein [Rufibacter quisquiliarum]
MANKKISELQEIVSIPNGTVGDDLQIEILDASEVLAENRNKRTRLSAIFAWARSKILNGTNIFTGNNNFAGDVSFNQYAQYKGSEIATVEELEATAYTDTQAIAAAKTNIGTGAENFAAGNLLATAQQQITDLASTVNAINAIIGPEAGDGDAVVNTVREMLSVLQNYTEGVDLAAQLAGKEPALPPLGAAGTALMSNGSAKAWLPVTATAGGTLEGAVQVRKADGTVTGNDNLRMFIADKLLTLGVGWKFKIDSTVSRITASPNKTMEFIFSDGLPVAATFKSTTGKTFLFFRTSGDQAVIVGEAFDHNANIGMTSKKRMGAVATASATKAYFKIPDGSADIQMNIANNGNNITGRMVFIGRSETQYIKVIMEVSAFKTGGVITVDNQVARTTSLGSSITATCGIEATGDNMGIKVFVTPGVASALDWTLYNDYLDI